ncbi:MAG: holo-ACP synthase [Proteobacteria bacterium]|nr:holo-ACP synthase [Pseudomonadota bacterium]
MNILGIGTDLVALARIETLLARFGDKFIARILAPDEKVHYEQSANSVSYFAKRFAAKEAVAKAFGTGIGANLAFNEISITNLESGQPVVSFLGKSKGYVETLNIQQIHISLSDEKLYALAFVVILI